MKTKYLMNFTIKVSFIKDHKSNVEYPIGRRIATTLKLIGVLIKFKSSNTDIFQIKKKAQQENITKGLIIYQEIAISWMFTIVRPILLSVYRNIVYCKQRYEHGSIKL